MDSLVGVQGPITYLGQNHKGCQAERTLLAV